MSSSKPLVSLLVVVIVGFLAVGIVGFHTLKDGMIEVKKQDIAAILNIARSQSTHYISQYQLGILTKEQAEENIVHFLSSLRYEADYVWANDSNGIGRVHPRKEIVGQFQSSYPNHIAKLADKDIFFLTKTNIKPVSDEIIIKTNGVVKLPEWNWVIGFGLYMDDMNGMILSSAKAFIATILISTFLAFLVAYYWLRQSR